MGKYQSFDEFLKRQLQERDETVNEEKVNEKSIYKTKDVINLIKDKQINNIEVNEDGIMFYFNDGKKLLIKIVVGVKGNFNFGGYEYI